MRDIAAWLDEIEEAKAVQESCRDTLNEKNVLSTPEESRAAFTVLQLAKIRQSNAEILIMMNKIYEAVNGTSI